MTPTSTPLWLDLRTEYIDDNFDNLVEYLRKADKNESFYKKTIDLLEQRIEELINEISSCRLYADNADNDKLKKAKMLAVYLLTSDSKAKYSTEAFVALMKELSIMWPNHAKALINKAIDRLTNTEIVNQGFTWQNYSEIHKELFTYNLINNAKFINPIKGFKYISSHGTAILNNTGLYLCSKSLKESYRLLNNGAQSMDTGVGIRIITPPGEKLKQSQEKEIKAISDFVKDLRLDFQASNFNVKARKGYSDGDEATVKVLKKSNGFIFVKTCDDDYKTLEGQIIFRRPSIIYYQKRDIYDFISEGDVLKATIKNVNRGEFDIENQFVDFVLSDVKEHLMGGATLAKCIKKDNYGNLIWITEDGYPIHTPASDEYGKDSLAVVEITDIRYNNNTIHASIEGAPEEGDNDFVTTDSQKGCFRDYIASFSKNTTASMKNNEEPLSPIIINILVRQLFDYQKTLLKPSERYKNLSLAMFLAMVVDDDDSVAYIDFSMSYLQSLLAFVNDEPVDELLTGPEDAFANAESTQQRISIVELLREYGKNGNDSLLNDAIDSGKPMISQLAQLIQSANRMKGILTPGALSVIKHEILKALSVESEEDTDLEADSGTYIGMESSTMEFKTSVVYEPKRTDIPNETAQNFNIAKAVCAFLNSQAGGTLYIGVNDQGYVVGFDNDMKFLKCTTIDSFIRYVQDMLTMKLGVDAIYYIKIEPAYDNKVVMLHVEPHPYQVVELDNKAYIRVNNESREMPDEMQLELLSEKRKKDKGKAANLSWLHRGYQLKKCVILHNYHSSHGGEIKDRHIEPYKVLPEDNLVLGFDIDKGECRVFNINRIDYVELKENENWGHTAMHQDTEIDAFHLSGANAYKVSFKLDLLARNQLIEEFPRTRDKIECDANDNNVWYYNDTVRSILGITRFYMGLAEHITIVEAPDEFKNKIKELAERVLKQS